MHAAQGILTARGGMTSHAAVVARGMGRPCVSGAGAVSIDRATRTLRIGTTELKEGDSITLDGATGQVMLGIVPTVEPELAGDFGTLMVWADKLRRMKVRTNAETPDDCRMARQFGAEGIGLCRTEHMFFEASRISLVRQMILADDEAGRRRALEQLLPEQRADFTAIFEVMAGLPCTIRLLDPPTKTSPTWPMRPGWGSTTSSAGRASCMNSTRCWAIVAVVSGSPSLKSTRCRRGRSLKPCAR
jgi:pyruvate,orthophosphate dikinase